MSTVFTTFTTVASMTLSSFADGGDHGLPVTLYHNGLGPSDSVDRPPPTLVPPRCWVWFRLLSLWDQIKEKYGETENSHRMTIRSTVPLDPLHQRTLGLWGLVWSLSHTFLDSLFIRSFIVFTSNPVLIPSSLIFGHHRSKTPPRTYSPELTSQRHTQ